jgi:hypothetical protein
VKSLFDAPARAEIQERLARLGPGTRGLWGRMSAPQMLAHVADQLRMALGDIRARPVRTPLRYPVLRELIVYLLPWPRGAPTAPELLSTAAGDWAGDVEALHALIGRFAERGPRAPWSDSSLTL